MYERHHDVIVLRHPFAVVRERLGWTSYAEAAKGIQALVLRHCGVRIEARREKPYRWEHYRTVAPEPLVQLALARELDVPVDRVAAMPWPAWLPVGDDIDIDLPWNPAGAAQALDEAVTRALQDRRGFMIVAGGTLAALCEDWVGLQPERLTRALDGGRVDDDLIDTLEDDLTRLRRLDDVFGGARSREVIHAHLALVTGLLDNANSTAATRTRLFAVATEVANLAGWAACDAGLHAAAQRYWTAALRTAHEIGDSPAGANILYSMALQCLDQGDLGGARRTATAAVESGSRSAPRVRAMMLARQARVHAASGERAACERTLSAAEAAFDRTSSDSNDPPWSHYFDAGEFASQVGNCYLLLGNVQSADAWLQRGIAEQDTTRIRDHATYLLWWANARLDDHELAAGAALAVEAVPLLTRSTGSWRNRKRVRDLRARLRPHTATHPGARDAYEHLSRVA